MKTIQITLMAEIFAIPLALTLAGCGGDATESANTLPSKVNLNGTYRLTTAACTAGTARITSGLSLTFANSSLTSTRTISSACSQSAVFSLSSFTENSFSANPGAVTCAASCRSFDNCEEGQGSESIAVNYTISGNTLITTETSAHDNCTDSNGKITSTYIKQP